MSIWNLAGWLYQQSNDAHEEVSRRRAPRKRITEAVVIRWDAEADIMGRTLDVAPDALGVRLTTAIPPHTQVLVRTSSRAGAWCPAYVVHSTTTLGGYKVGLRML